ncbi:MAG: acetyltransferase [Nitrobacter sp.]
MTSKPIIIFGDGELADVAAFYFQHDTDREVAGFSVDSAYLKKSQFRGQPVHAFEEVVSICPPSEYDFFVAIGYAKVNGLREQKCLAVRDKGYALTSYVSSKATVFPDLTHGWNCFILEDNTIQPFVSIGNGVTLWSGNHLGHHSSVGDFAFISSHVVISGGVKIGARSFMGVNSTTNDHIQIGERCVVGSGSLVTKNLADESVVFSEPAALSKVPSPRLKGF